MCGICGQFSENNIIDDNIENQKKYFNLINKRGTDFFELKFKNVFIGYSNFPIRNSFDKNDLIKDDILVLLNGEIYNCPPDKSEFNYIRETYIKKGIAGFNKFTGKFIILIYDEKKKALYIIRDYFGKIPFFYVVQDNIIYFSSLASSLLDILKDHQLDYIAQLEEEIFRYRGYDRTKYKNIHQIPPNTIMCCQSGKITYKPLKNQITYNTPVDRSYEDILNDLLVESVTATFNNLEKDRPIGVLVSGVDSYIIFKILEKYFDGEILAFVFYSHMNPFNFTYNPDKTKVEKIKVTFKDFYQNIRECISLFQGINRTQIKSYIFGKKIKEKYNNLKVVYCGEGADELFGGYTANIFHLDVTLKYKKYLKDYPECSESLVLKDYLNTKRNIKSICSFFQKHQLVEVHLNPFNICFQNFLLELRSPFLTEKLHAFSKILPEDYFKHKIIIKNLAKEKYDFDPTGYKKISLPESILFV